jgi:cephalosporin hydroxylase
MTDFERRNQEMIGRMAQDQGLRTKAKELFDAANSFEYSYHFSWLGRPIIQYPQDILAMQEILWRVKPELVVETGIAHGGSLVLSASLMELIGRGHVIGVDIDIREHTRTALASHPMMKRITLIEGSSTDEAVAAEVYKLAEGKRPVVVVLDSNHTHEHVMEELRLYSPLVGKDSCLVVMDTVVEDMPDDAFPHRPWGPGNNPKTAVREFLRENKRFVVDTEIENKLVLTVAPEGYLRCIAD